jgi:hypothetical protein
MAGYRLYFMDKQDHITEAVELECEDDSHAIRQAEPYLDGREVELWRRARVVMRFPATDRAGNPPVGPSARRPVGPSARRPVGPSARRPVLLDVQARTWAKVLEPTRTENACGGYP